MSEYVGGISSVKPTSWQLYSGITNNPAHQGKTISTGNSIWIKYSLSSPTLPLVTLFSYKNKIKNSPFHRGISKHAF